MTIPVIPKQDLIMTADLNPEQAYGGLRIVRCQSDPDAAKAFNQNSYQFQHQHGNYTPLKATLARKGISNSPEARIVVAVNTTLQEFVELVKYDPANPPLTDYGAHGMIEAHERTQSDFKGAKTKNTNDFRNYVLEGVESERTLYLPTISGWQSENVLDDTVFVAFDEENENAMYGIVYLPKAPIMQADGQTQTAALFAVARTKEAVATGALENLTTSLEIELGVSQMAAGQSFADRNGRGTKKNKNLVIALDTSAAVSQLRLKAIEGTVFDGRLADGRTGGASLTATKNILDLSTMEQILLNVATGGAKKPEHVKHHHIQPFLPFAEEFLKILEDTFGAQWPEKMPSDQDTYRRVYVHGWAFALKALAIAYHRVRIGEIGPLAEAIGIETPGKTAEEAFIAAAAANSEGEVETGPITLDEFKDRLGRIDWVRHRKHWIAITGASEKEGVRLKVQLKDGSTVVKAQSPNTGAVISKVADRILSNSWDTLTASEDEPI